MSKNVPGRRDHEVMLCHSGGSLVMPLTRWQRYLTDAQAHGWVPAGTSAPEPDSLFSELWNGAYDVRKGQKVDGLDALHLADTFYRMRATANSEKERFDFLLLGDFTVQGEFTIL